MDLVYLESEPDIVLFRILDNLSAKEIHDLIATSKTLKQRIIKKYFGLELIQEHKIGNIPFKLDETSYLFIQIMSLIDSDLGLFEDIERYDIEKYNLSFSPDLKPKIYKILTKYLGLLLNEEGKLDENTVKEAIWADNEIGYEFLLLRYPVLVKNFKSEYGAKFTRNLLREQAPHIFEAEYPRICQRVRPVTFFKEEDAPFWDYQKVNGEPRELLPFPPDNPEFQFISVTDEYPYPGLIKNNTSNKNKYPYLPCSFKTRKERDLSLKRAYPQIYGPAPVKPKEKFKMAPIERANIPFVRANTPI